MFLGVLHPDQSETMTITYIRELTQAETDSYMAANSIVAAYTSYRFAPRMVYENDKDFHAVMQDCLRHFFTHGSNAELLEGYAFVANKALLNYLSSVRFFTDFVRTKLARRFGNDSEQFTEFTKSLNASFDTSFAYRFFYKFRNYVQHCGHAVGEIEIKAKPGEDGWDASLAIFCNAEMLLEDYQEWGKVATDLREMNQIDLVSLVSDLTEEILGLDRLARSLITPGLEVAGYTIKTTISDGLGREGRPVLIDADVSEGLPASSPVKHPPLELLRQIGII